jgi:hypothetical protein
VLNLRVVSRAEKTDALTSAEVQGASQQETQAALAERPTAQFVAADFRNKIGVRQFKPAVEPHQASQLSSSR